MHLSPPRDFFEKGISVLFLIGVALSLTHTLWAYDVWWHLKTGEWIFTHQAVPRTNLYSFTAPTYPWVNFSWLFQLVLYLTYRLFGIPGIILLKVTIAVLPFLILLFRFYRRVALWPLFSVLILTLLTAHERLVERPEIFTYLFLVLYLFLIEKGRTKERIFYLLPLLQILWNNLHPLSVLGIGVIGITWLGQLLAWFPGEKRKGTPFPRTLFFVLSLSLLTFAATPYGGEGFLALSQTFFRSPGKVETSVMGIGEFTRPFGTPDPHPTLLFYKGLLFLTTFSFLLNRRYRLDRGLLFVCFTFFSLLIRRNIAPFALVSAFLLLENIEGYLRNRKHLPDPERPHLSNAQKEPSW